MKTGLLALLLLAGPLAAMAAETAPPARTLDVSGVTAIRITGEASTIALTTIEGGPLEARLDGRRAGWFSNWYSSWFYNDCRTASRMGIEGATLVVDVRASSWLEPSDCRVELTANLREGVAVAVAQHAAQVRLAGDFGALSLEAKAADVTLDGHAASVELRGDALRSHLAFTRTDGSETIAIAAHSLDADLGFAPGTRISYEVKATAAMVDSALPDTAGAKPAIAIAGDFVRATIR